MFEGKKITRATFKSFLNKNKANMYIKVKSSFDGMVDCCMPRDDDFSPIVEADRPFDNNLGIQGVWLVLGGRDNFSAYNENGFSGIRVYNCCGSFILAVKA